MAGGGVSGGKEDRGKNNVDTKQLDRFMLLFRGSTRSFGRWNPSSGQMFTEKVAVTPHDFFLHLDGRMGLGICPVCDNNTLSFAAIDIDVHDGQILNFNKLEKETRDSPLVLCRSKSGGAHLYLFGVDRLNIVRARRWLTFWAAKLGYPKAEIFPKQTSLGGMGPRMGTWINLPYFNAISTKRFAFHRGKELSLDGFLALAEKRAINNDDIELVNESEHPEAPPCVQRIMKDGVQKGQRNEALFSIVSYLRRTGESDYKEYAKDLASKIFDPPLDADEITRTTESASRRDYSYRCNVEPNVGYCDRLTCLKRKFGVKEDEGNVSIEFTELKKHESKPPLWEMMINQVKLTDVTTFQLHSFLEMRKLVIEALQIVMPMSMRKKWDQILCDLMETVEIIPAPGEASAAGMVIDAFQFFINKAERNGHETNDKERELNALIHGHPIIRTIRNKRFVVFRGASLLAYLQANVGDKPQIHVIWPLLKNLGADYGTIKVNKKDLPIWLYPAEDVPAAKSKLKKKKFSTEF